MTWRSPDTYHSAGHGRGTATLKFYEGRDILGGSIARWLAERVGPTGSVLATDIDHPHVSGQPAPAGVSMGQQK
jgi:hypothetical protein